MVRRLLLLAGIAVAGVILFHGAGWGFTAMFAWAHRYTTQAAEFAEARTGVTYAVFRLIEQLAVFSVPTFFFISGFFVAFAMPRTGSPRGWGGLGGRLVWLIVPYLVWNVVVGAELWLQGITRSAAGYARLLLTGGGTPAYYYIPALVQLYLLSPILVRWARWSWPSLVMLTGLVHVAVSLAPYLVSLGLTGVPWIDWVAGVPSWLFVGHVFWFTLGVLAGFYLPRIQDTLRRWRWWTLGGAVFLVVAGLIEWEMLFTRNGGVWLSHRATLVDSLYTAAVLGAFVGFSLADLRRNPRLEHLGAQSYGIYLVHPLGMEFVARGVYHFAPGLLAMPLVFSLLVMAAGLALPLGLMALVRQTALRPAYRPFFG